MDAEEYRLLPLNKAHTEGWKSIISKDLCVWCGNPQEKPTREHVLPELKGGKGIWDNIVGACAYCNHARGTKTIFEVLMNPPAHIVARRKL